MTNYVTAQPDYYESQYTEGAYKAILERLRDAESGQRLCISDDGLTTAGKVYRCWQKVKSFFGFENLTSRRKTNAELLKFLFYGTVQGYVQRADYRPIFSALSEKIRKRELRVDAEATAALALLAQPIEPNRLESIRAQLTTYCTTNAAKLTPSFWNRLFTKSIVLPPRPEFGDTYLALAQKREEYPEVALNDYYTAARTYQSQSPLYTMRFKDAFVRYEQVNLPYRNPFVNQQAASIY